MSKQYWHCNVCGGNFDHGESCDCKKHEPGPVFKVSETLVLGVDISGGKDISCIQIARVNGTSHEIINTLYGEEAEQTYDIITNRGGTIKV
jgi:hypothetical protein